MAQFPSSSSAYGIWTLQQQRDAVRGDNWPIYAFNPLYEPESFDLTNMGATASDTQSGVVTGNSHTYGFDPSGQYFFWAEFSSLNIRRATASTAFDINTLSNTQSIARSFGSSQFGVELNREGTKIFSYGYDSSNHIYSATLSTPWDLTTVSSWTGSGTSLLSEYNNGIRFSFDGTKLFTAGYNSSTGIRQYDLSTPFDASTATYVTGIATSNITTSLFFSGDGQNLVYYDSTIAAFRQVNLSTPFELSSAGTPTTVLSVSYGRGAYIDPQGNKFITYDQTNNTLYEHNTDTTKTVEYLVVAGGGGGGSNGGGGGAGGLITDSFVSSSGVTYTVTVGAGGTGGPSTGDAAWGADGTDSSFNSETAVGGGGGGGGNTASLTTYSSGRAGGSGGGGAAWYGNGAGGSGTAGQGNSGGGGIDTSPYMHGGGGGAGAAGAAGNTVTGFGGDGGDGLQNSITGTAIYYAGGGGGGTSNSATNLGSGGLGGGGDSASGDGSVNTGGGGGGGSSAATRQGGDGGSGVVILRTLQTASATTGSPTTTTDGSYNIYTFTGSGSITF